MRNIALAPYQPKYYKNSQLMIALNSAIEAELHRFWEDCERTGKEIRIKTTEEKISDWEKSVHLSGGSGLTLEERRSRVLAKKRLLGTTTKERIKVIAESYADGTVEVIENTAEYTIDVIFTNRVGRPARMDEIIEQVDRIIPAHLAVNYTYPYRTWTEVMASGRTWLDAANDFGTWKNAMELEEE